MDLAQLRRFFEETPREDIPVCMLTLTNNSGGGQPVSLANVKATSELCTRVRHPASTSTPAASPRTPGSSSSARQGQGHRSVAEIVREVFSYADGCTMSAKKDGLVNIGGLFCTRDEELLEAPQAAADRASRASRPTAASPAATWKPWPAASARCWTRATSRFRMGQVARSARC